MLLYLPTDTLPIATPFPNFSFRGPLIKYLDFVFQVTSSAVPMTSLQVGGQFPLQWHVQLQNTKLDVYTLKITDTSIENMSATFVKFQRKLPKGLSVYTCIYEETSNGCWWLGGHCMKVSPKNAYRSMLCTSEKCSVLRSPNLRVRWKLHVVTSEQVHLQLSACTGSCSMMQHLPINT